MIEIEKLTARLENRSILLDISLTVPAAQCLALLGPSGSGKTTLLRILAGLDKPDAGTVSINSEVVSSPSKLAPPYTRSIGMVFQDLALWPHMTARQQLDFALGSIAGGRPARVRKIESALSRVKLEKLQQSYPHQLSGGERQRLALARALIQEPAILLLDEPFSGLDMSLKNELLEEIRQIIRDMQITTIFVTHQVPEAEYLADRIVMIKNGRIRPQEILEGEKMPAEPGSPKLVCHPGGKNI